ncbi:MAG: ATP-binding protein, partial [Thermoproteus sp.]
PMALAFSGWFLFAIPLWLYTYRRVRRWYRVPYLLLSLSHVSRASSLPASREMLETMASAEAAAFGMMEKWAVAFTDMPPEVVHKKFVKAYEGRDTGKRLIRIRELSEFVERMAKYNERPVLLYPYGSKDLHSIYMAQDWIAAYDFWVLKNGVRAMSHDLSRFPMFYGGKLLAVGREVVL